MLLTPAIEGLFTYVVTTADFLYRFAAIGLLRSIAMICSVVYRFLFFEVIGISR